MNWQRKASLFPIKPYPTGREILLNQALPYFTKCVESLVLLTCGDIIVSQDYGVAAMVLGKGAYAIHQSGKWYTNENIDQMLMERHLNKKARRASGKKHLKGPRKRTSEDDEHFRESFEKMIHMAMDKEK